MLSSSFLSSLSSPVLQGGAVADRERPLLCTETKGKMPSSRPHPAKLPNCETISKEFSVPKKRLSKSVAVLN